MTPLTLDKIKESTDIVAQRKFQIFNKKWVGPLFSGDGTDKNNNNVAWVEENRNYFNNGKEEFYIIRTGKFSFGNEEFKIKNVKHCAYLQLDYNKDSYGDYYVTLSKNEEDPRQSWYIVNVDNTQEFKIINKKKKD